MENDDNTTTFKSQPKPKTTPDLQLSPHQNLHQLDLSHSQINIYVNPIMPPKRKVDDTDDANSPIAQSTPSDISARRKVTAAGGLTGLNTTPCSTATDGHGRMRKKRRLEQYYESQAALNNDFAEFARRAEHRIALALENGTEIQPDDRNFVEEAQQYIAHAAAIRKKFFPTNGDVLTCGTNEFGQIAQSDAVQERRRPTQVKSLTNSKVTQVACGGLHNISVTDEGKVDTWGCNDEGSLGNIEAETAYAPVRVSGFVPSAKELATGLERPLYTLSDLKGSRSSIDFTDPKVPLDPKYEEMIVAVDAGDCHCLALSNAGRVYFFGAYKDREGRCWGDIPPSDDPRIHPKEKERVLIPPTGKRDWPIHVWQLGAEATAVACGFSFSVALVKTVRNGVQGQGLLTWGMGECGELARPVFAPVKKTEEEIAQIPKEVLDKSQYATFHVDKVATDYMPPQFAQFVDGANDRIVENMACGGYRKYTYSGDVIFLFVDNLYV